MTVWVEPYPNKPKSNNEIKMYLDTLQMLAIRMGTVHSIIVAARLIPQPITTITR